VPYPLDGLLAALVLIAAAVVLIVAICLGCVRDARRIARERPAVREFDIDSWLDDIEAAPERPKGKVSRLRLARDYDRQEPTWPTTRLDTPARKAA
jgi:hypothetical protein